MKISPQVCTQLYPYSVPDRRGFSGQNFIWQGWLPDLTNQWEASEDLTRSLSTDSLQFLIGTIHLQRKINPTLNNAIYFVDMIF